MSLIRHIHLQRTEIEKFLINRVKAEVSNRLEHSLNNTILLNLGKENQPQQVSRFWDAEIKTGVKVNKIFPSGTSILDIFDRDDIAGNLLILGSPGSGKTVTMLELAKSLIERAEQQNDYPIPVLFNLTSWTNDNQFIIDWLIRELNLKYGIRVDIAKKLLENRRFLPMLDGLDELKPVRQESCVLAINKFLLSENRPTYIVIASRKEEYENYDLKLLLMGSITLKPLTYFQIRDYLDAVQRNDLWKAVKLYDELLDLLSIPLFLNIAVLAEEELSVERWKTMTSKKDRIDFLLAAYVHKMLNRKIKSYLYKTEQPTIKQTQKWLIWMSRILQKQSKTEFLIEELQPSFLPIKTRDEYKSKYRMLGIVLAILAPTSIVFGWIGFYTKNIEIIDFKFAESRTWSWQKAKKSILSKDGGNYLFANIIVFTILMILLALKLLTIDFLFAYVSVLGFSVYFFGISKGPEIIIKNIPNQGILKEFKNFRNKYFGLHIFFWMFFSVFFCFFLPLVLLGKIIFSISLGFVLGGLIACFLMIPIYFWWVVFGGGKPCTQHFILRYTLYKSGDIPWNYARFLDYATEKLFLQRIGGRYRFIHRMLQDHFSMMSFEE